MPRLWPHLSTSTTICDAAPSSLTVHKQATFATSTNSLPSQARGSHVVNVQRARGGMPAAAIPHARKRQSPAYCLQAPRQSIKMMMQQKQALASRQVAGERPREHRTSYTTCAPREAHPAVAHHPLGL